MVCVVICSLITFVARRNLAATSRITYTRPAALHMRERTGLILSSLHARDAEFMHADYCSIRSGRVSPTIKVVRESKSIRGTGFGKFFYFFNITSR